MSCASANGNYTVNVTGAVGAKAFYQCSTLTYLYFTELVTSIGKEAFGSCSRLSSVVIGDSVKQLGPYCFNGCKALWSVYISDSVTTIENSAFDRCSNLTHVRFGNNVKTVGKWAFLACSNLVNFTLTDSVTTVGDSTFCKCTKLESITLGNSLTALTYQMFWMCYSLVNVTLGNSLKTIGAEAFYECTALEEVFIPNSVTTFGKRVFGDCTQLRKINIPDRVTVIPIEMFVNCRNLSSVTLGEKVSKIDENAFLACYSLTSFYIPASITVINEEAFSKCRGIMNFTVSPNSTHCTAVDGVLFNYNMTLLIQFPLNSEITFYAVPDSVIRIANSSFSERTIPLNVTCGKSVEVIGYRAFYYASGLVSMKLSDSVTELEREAFYCCRNLTDVTFSASLRILNIYAFSKSGIKRAEFSDSLTTIGDWAFAGCSSLEKVSCDNGTVHIGRYAFEDCNSLSDFTWSDHTTYIGQDSFDTSKIERIHIGPMVSYIGNGAFDHCDYVSDIYVDPANMYYSMDNGALLNFNKSMLIKYAVGNTRVSYTVPNVTEHIIDLAFYHAKKLKHVEFSQNLLIIDYYSFYESTLLENITIPDSVVHIDSFAFSRCFKVASIVIGNSVEYIGEYGFEACDNVKVLTLPASVSYIGDMAFSISLLQNVFIDQENRNFISVNGILFNFKKTKLVIYPAGRGSSYSIPEGVTEIGYGAFSDSHLSTVYIPASVRTIAGYGFWNAWKLGHIYYKGSSSPSYGSWVLSYVPSSLKIHVYPEYSGTSWCGRTVVKDMVRTPTLEFTTVMKHRTSRKVFFTTHLAYIFTVY